MSMLDKTQLLNKWLEQELNTAEQQQFETWCRQDPQFAERVALLGKLETGGNQFQELPVPEWDPGAIFTMPAKREPWWQWPGLSMLSFATSIAAIFLVLFRMEVTVGDGVLQVSFAQETDQAQIEQLVATRLSEFEAEQAKRITEQNENLVSQQMQMNNQLASYLLATSRTERREDFAELIKFVNQQRSDDQVFYARQFNKLQQDFVANSEMPEWQPAGFRNQNPGNE